jgi:phosphoserine phosphatase RsbU/P
VRSLFAHRMSPAEILSILNANLIARYQVANYIAVSYLRLDLRDGTGYFANGGMPFPYLIREGDISQLKVSGVPLGLLEDSSYDEMTLKVEKGDMLVLTSDGTTDAMNPDGQMYDVDRFMKAIRLHSSEGVAEMVKNLYLDVSQFAAHADVSDDVTILALRRL